MKLYEKYPDAVEINGWVFPLDLDFRNVIRAFDIQDEEGWTVRDKLELQCKLLLKDPDDCPATMMEMAALLEAIFALFPKKESDDRERFIDFHQDASAIRSGFSRLGIDLTRDRLHFFRFLELLSDLPEDSALMRTIDIRSKPMPKATAHNHEQIAALQKAKARVALKLTDEERMRSFAKALKNSTILRG